MRWGRALGFLVGSLGLPLLAFEACGGSAVGSSDAGGTQDGGPTLDATTETGAGPDGGTKDTGAVPETGTGEEPSGLDAGCVPLPVDGGLQFVPPHAPMSVCTLTQIQDLYADCWGSTATTTACNDFYGDPTNSPCIKCMITQSTDSTWGPVIIFGDNSGYANLGGCIAYLTDDAGAGGCAQTIELLQQCYEKSCSVGCPDNTSAEAGTTLSDCHQQARSTTCGEFATGATSCENASQNSACIFANFEADFIGIGELFCAADGG